MADLSREGTNGCDFKEACCIDAGRVFDSCCDRDCLEDLRCFFTEEGQNCIEKAVSVKMRSAEVLNVHINVEPVNFNRGFFACDLTFLFLIDFDVYTSSHGCPTHVKGIATHSKRVILYGGDGNVRIFSNTAKDSECRNTASERTTNMPKCVVQSVDPIPLSCRIGEVRDCCESVGMIPNYVNDMLGGCVAAGLGCGAPTVYVTLGLFTIVQLIRQVQMLIPVYDFCIPEKQCDDTTDQPCDVFRRIKFPTDDFFPKSCETRDSSIGCGCNNKDD